MVRKWAYTIPNTRPMKYMGLGHYRIRAEKWENVIKKGKAACIQETLPFCVIFYNKLGSFPCIHSATLTGRTYTPSAA